MRSSHLFLIAILVVNCGCGKKTKDDTNTPIVQTKEQQIDSTKEFLDLVKSEKTDEALSFLPTNRIFIRFNQINIGAETLLTWTIKYNPRLAFVLVDEAQLDKEKVNQEGFTPLILASRFNQYSIVKKLVEKNVNLNFTSPEGNNALYEAILYKNEEVAIHLLRSGTDFRAKNVNGLDALELAQINQLNRLIKEIELRLPFTEGLPSLNDFRNIIVESDVSTLERLLFNHDKLLYYYQDIKPILTLIDLRKSESEIISIIEIFLRYGASLNETNYQGMNSLIVASKNNFINIITLLLEKKVSPNQIDQFGKSSLYYAIENNSLEAVKILFQYSPLVRYQYRGEDNRQKNINLCNFAKQKISDFENFEDVITNREIQFVLGCGLRGRR